MNPDQATFERRELHGHSTLVITGEIDIANAPTFLDELIATAAEAHSPAVVDMSAVTFLDSSGLNALVNARRRLEDTDVSLVLLNPSPPAGASSKSPESTRSSRSSPATRATDPDPLVETGRSPGLGGAARRYPPAGERTRTVGLQCAR